MNCRVEVWSSRKFKYSSKEQVPSNYTEVQYLNVLSYFPPLIVELCYHLTLMQPWSHSTAVGATSLHTCQRRTDGAASIQCENCYEWVTSSEVWYLLHWTHNTAALWKRLYAPNQTCATDCLVSVALISLQRRHTPHIETPAFLSCHSFEDLKLGHRSRRSHCKQSRVSMSSGIKL